MKTTKIGDFHDGMLVEGRNMVYHKMPELFLGEAGVHFVSLKEGESTEF